MDCLQTPYKLKPPSLNKQQLKSYWLTIFSSMMMINDFIHVANLKASKEPVQDIPLFFLVKNEYFG